MARPGRNAAINGMGLWTHYRRGLKRYLRYGLEGVGGPLVSSLLFLAVFSIALPGGVEPQPGVDLLRFLAPGIAAYALFHNAFENAAASVVYDKMEGMIQDLLMAPLSPGELLAGYVLASASSGLITGTGVLLGLSVFVNLTPLAISQVLLFATVGAVLFALLGLLAGLWARKWDHYAAVEIFLILPLGLLSGTFFTPSVVPELGQHLLYANPVFYAVDGLRAGFTGQAESSVTFGLGLLVGLITALWLLAWWLIARGWHLRE